MPDSNRRQTSRPLLDDVRSLTVAERPRNSLPVILKAGAIPSGRGVSAAPPKSNGGIASPLTEDDFNTRTYHEESVMLSGDFLVGMEIKPLKQITMKDANGEKVLMIYADPSETP